MNPAPWLVIEGPRALITGVPFTWATRCDWCQATGTLTSYGTVAIGLAALPRETPRWYLRDDPGPVPAPPERCPACVNPGLCDESAREAVPAWGDATLPLLGRAWAALRGAYPAEADTADRADRRSFQRPAETKPDQERERKGTRDD
jgi:hypothetical protein